MSADLLGPGTDRFPQISQNSLAQQKPGIARGVFACRLLLSELSDASKGNPSEEVEFSDKFDKFIL
jgi:hypothetical protein